MRLADLRPSAVAAAAGGGAAASAAAVTISAGGLSCSLCVTLHPQYNIQCGVKT